MDLRDFSQKSINDLNNDFKKTVFNKADKIEEELKQKEPETYESINDAYNKYSSMSGDSLVDELLKVTKQQKEEGNFDKTQIENTYNMLYPMLNDEQRKKLDSLIKMIL
ncbi:MAG: hypothetical protein PHC46_02495 [Clostridia bacterium]|nr:hypothetical protein [Clostridia bacterium]